MSKPAILLKDDTETTLDVLSRYLERDFQLECSISGTKTPEMVISSEYSSLLADIYHFEKNTFQVLTRLIKNILNYINATPPEVKASAFESGIKMRVAFGFALIISFILLLTEILTESEIFLNKTAIPC